MSKKQKQFAAMLAIVFAMYNVIIFAVFGFGGHEAPFWLSYIFVLIAFGVVEYSFILLGRNGMEIRDWLFGYPIIRHCAIYAALELILSLIFMIFEYDLSWVLPFVAQVLLLGAYGIMLISCFIAKEEIGELHEKVQEKTRYISLLQADAQMLVNKCADETLKAKCEKLAEAIRYSDPMSSELLEELEKRLSASVTACATALDEGNLALADHLCDQAMLQLQERNLKCKALK